MKSAAARGRDFEAEIAEFLRAAGFGVTSNAKVATPRQTDLFARSGDVDLLVEVKHRDRKIDVSDIDALRSRLNRVAPEVVGAIFTRSALTKNAIKAIELDRTREILVFVQEEIEQLYSQPRFLRALLDRKRSELRVQGRVWLSGSLHNEFANVRLPLGSVEFKLEKKVQAYFESESGFSGAFFALQIPDPGWGSLSGEGARLSMRLELHRVEDLRNIFGYLHQKFGLSNDGMFSIQQSQCCWHGIGAENFLRSLEQPFPRYSASRSQEFHHSEECQYFDRFRDGWLEISCQREIELGEQRHSFLHHSEIVIQLSGIPVVLAPFIELCRYTGNEWATFEYLPHRMTLSRRLQQPRVLRIVGTVTNKEPDVRNSDATYRSVSGIIAENPFYKTALPKELLGDELPSLHGLAETQLLLCSLRHWHGDDEAVNNYSLKSLEVTVTGAAVVIRLISDWDRLINGKKRKRRAD